MAQKRIWDFFSNKQPNKKETFCRSFNGSWFDRWKWLHYVEESDHIMCFTCVKAVQKRLINEDSVRMDVSSFVKGGFSNWRKATEKFNELHSDSSQRIAALGSTPINAHLSDAARKTQNTARNVLELMFRSVIFPGEKGIAFRGDNSRDGVLYELMLERTYTSLKRENGCLGGIIGSRIRYRMKLLNSAHMPSRLTLCLAL